MTVVRLKAVLVPLTVALLVGAVDTTVVVTVVEPPPVAVTVTGIVVVEPV